MSSGVCTLAEISITRGTYSIRRDLIRRVFKNSSH